MKRACSTPNHRTTPRMLALAVALSCFVPMLAQAAQPAPMKIADQRSANLRLNAASLGRIYEIRTFDASFVKVHFDHFSLPDGVTLEVFSPDRTQMYRYSNATRDGNTVDAAMGQDGRTRFSAMSIHGPVALMRLVGTPQGAWRSDDGIRVSRYLQGYSERKLRELKIDGMVDGGFGTRSIIGTDDKRAAACYASSDPTAFDRSRPVARLVMSGGGLCTTWRAGPDNRMFTNNHCIATASATASAEVWFNYQLSSCGGAAATPTKVAGDQMLATNTTLDYTLYTVKNFANIASFGYLGLETRAATLNEEIMIAGHPGGRQKELSIVSDQDGGGRCRVNTASVDSTGTNTAIGYYCDTEGGSSGSPVIARASNRAIALHHYGVGTGSVNRGVKMSLIWPQVSTHFGGVAPGGDNDGGGNTPPVANFTSSISGLTVSFTDTSTDSNGSIASRSWNFGDGTTSTAANPSRTYAAAGTYTVTLTVTDNGGATNTTTRSVTVGSSGGTQTYTNTTDYTIADNATVSSPIVVSGRTGNGSATTPVAVNIVHTYKGDLKVDLVAPDGSVYVLHNRAGGSADNIVQTFTVNLSTEALNGTWNLRVNDNASADTGYINSWSVTF